MFLGQPVLQVEATDMDRGADLEYDIVDPITARDKTGNILTNRAAYDFGAAFAIDPKSGQIFVQEPLSYSSAAVIILTIQVSYLFTFHSKICLTGDTNRRIDTVSRCFENKNNNCCETKFVKMPFVYYLQIYKSMIWPP